jgi:hypothetical protein
MSANVHYFFYPPVTLSIKDRVNASDFERFCALSYSLRSFLTDLLLFYNPVSLSALFVRSFFKPAVDAMTIKNCRI